MKESSYWNKKTGNKKLNYQMLTVLQMLCLKTIRKPLKNCLYDFVWEHTFGKLTI